MDSATAAALEAKIQKSEQFQVMAEVAVDLKAYDAACSLAVSAGINASDAAIMQGGSPRPAGSDHSSAVSLLRRIAGNSTAQQLSGLLRVKNRAQYDVTRCTMADATEAVKRSGRLLDKSKGLINVRR
jgi:hypothetical protein